MSENQLFLVLLAGLFVVGSIIFVSIGLLGASDQLLGFLAVVIGCLGSLVVAQVPPWYESRRRRRR
ncbi:MAG TPA: hypothetical protein VFJ57_04700 [Solirubrobacterales bacterium]|nr:hypothetical protein [Solirubrobacterales bacterium]